MQIKNQKNLAAGPFLKEKLPRKFFKGVEEKKEPFVSLLLFWTLVFWPFTAVVHALKSPLDAAAAAADSELSGALSDSLSNHMTVMAYSREEEEQKYIDELAEKAHRTRLHSWWAAVTADIVMGIMTGFLQIWTAWECFKGMKAGTISIGDFATYQSYVGLIGMNLWNFSRALRRLSVATSEATEMAEHCFTKPEIVDVPGAKALAVTSGRIEFRNVGFRYSDDDTQELNVNLTIASGESIAFVGPSGAGKTTLVKLLLRMYEPQKGSLYIDGQDIRSVTQRSLRQSMASVMQDPALFHRTLRENIAFSRPDATDEMIIAAAKKAHAWNFIKRMKDGLDTVVGERGVKLSGGQRQRITLARAFLSDARIIILDEATNALDSMTEKFVQQAIKALLHEGKTCIVIAHRLSTIMEANRIVVMKEGRIVEQGTHEELLAEEKGLYRTLWDHQSYGCIGEEVEAE